MEVQSGNRKVELSSNNSSDNSATEIMHNKSVKRPFDVAFLMLPDEKMKQHKLQVLKQQKTEEITPAERCYEDDVDDDDDDEEIDIEHLPRDNKSQKYFVRQQVFDDPNKHLLINKNSRSSFERDNHKSPSSPTQKSAFTKVNLINKSSDNRDSPNLSLSPDISYQNSLSPSPPISNTRSYQTFLTPEQIFKSHQQLTAAAYHSNFLPETFHHENHPFFNSKPHPQELLQPNFPKIRTPNVIYRPEIPPTFNYPPQFSNNQDIRSPAAAILTSLLPPSLAALSLPAQNVCAKCNITFRMTSDLVYHMRSHHKNETSDATKRRREEKLKCPVCAESFRERHHLTRHMTAHQDKEKDEKSVGVSNNKGI